MSWFGPNLDCSCCCIPPEVSCELRSGTTRTFDYTIENADSAWFVKTCYEDTVPTETTVDIDPVNGSFTAEPNCFYVLYAEGCGETVSTQCNNEGTCMPCGAELGTFEYGVITIEDIPDSYTSPCSTGGWANIDYTGFGGWNGTFIWTNATSITYLELGLGTVTTPFTTFNVKYGIRFQCQRADPGWCYEYETFDATGFKPATNAHTVSDSPMTGGCVSTGDNLSRLSVPNLSSSTHQYIITCSTAPISFPPDLPFIFGTWERWFVTEFS